MTSLYRFITFLVSFILAFVGFCLVTDDTGNFGLLLLLFCMPVLWSSWFVCAILNKRPPGWQLILLWLLIDIVALGVLNLLLVNAQKIGGPSGGDFGFLIAFSPFILPIIFLGRFVPIIALVITAISRGASAVLLPSGYVGVLDGWLDFSIISALSCWLFIAIYRYLYQRFNRDATT